MEYADGDHRMVGLWNHEKLCFEGTLQKRSEGEGDQTQMGGTIVSSLISGHDGYGDGEEIESLRRATSFSFSSHPGGGGGGAGTRRTFVLSPCSHLHPHGIAPAALPDWFTV